MPIIQLSWARNKVARKSGRGRNWAGARSQGNGFLLGWGNTPAFFKRTPMAPDSSLSQAAAQPFTPHLSFIATRADTCSALHPVEQACSPFLRSSYMREVFFQLFHPFQGCILGFSIFQQSSHVEHIVQVRLNLHLQLVALSVFQLLKSKMWEKVVVEHLWKQNIITQQPYIFLFVPNSLVFSKRGFDISWRKFRSNHLRGGRPSNYFLGNILSQIYTHFLPNPSYGYIPT